MLSKLKTALGGAEGILAERDKITAAIERERAKLTELIGDRENAETELAAAEIDGSDTGKARRKLDSVRRAMEDRGLTLRRLRQMLATLAKRIDEAHRNLNQELPAHYETIRERFAAEWLTACETFAAALGKRRAIEALTGAPLALPDPAPITVELPVEFSLPIRRRDDLLAALSSIAEMAAGSEPVMALPGRVLNPYDPALVYVLQRDCEGLPAGARVVTASLSDGLLARLVAIGDAIPAGAAEAGQGTLDAAWALNSIKQEAAVTARLRSIEAEHARVRALPKFSYRECGRPSGPPSTSEEWEEAERERSEADAKAFRGKEGTLV